MTRHVRIWLAVVLAVIIVGTAGYVVFEKWSLDDALYMTVITLTTVGFHEVRVMDGAGRAWTMLLAVGGVGIIFGSIGIVAEAVVAEVASGRQERRRMENAVRALKGHFILCGYGRVGATVAAELAHATVPFVVIDANPESLADAIRDGYAVVEGDATRDAILLQAGVDRARGLITTVDSDANNVYVTLSARAMNQGLFIVARANLEGSEVKMLQAGADRAVSPYARAGRQIAELATRPRVADFIDFALSHGELSFSIEEIEVAAGGPLEGRGVGSLAAEGVHLLAIVRGPRDYEPNPPADRVLRPGDGLIVSGTAELLRAFAGRA
ncbi:MAG: potassium channel protein [Chloroflexota bacterium]|nr:potassium channel protein [Chloroflexota bacterium]